MVTSRKRVREWDTAAAPPAWQISYPKPNTTKAASLAFSYAYITDALTLIIEHASCDLWSRLRRVHACVGQLLN
jgi:hypothetical protein